MKKIVTAFLLFVALTASHLGYAQAIVEPSPEYAFDYQLVVVDALTKGKITTETTQFEVAVLVTNHSKNVKPGTYYDFSFADGYLGTGRGLIFQKFPTTNGFLGHLDTMYRKFIYANGDPIKLTKRLPKDLVKVGMDIRLKVRDASSPKPIFEKVYNVEDIAYMFSNDEIISQLYYRVNSSSNR